MCYGKAREDIIIFFKKLSLWKDKVTQVENTQPILTEYRHETTRIPIYSDMLEEVEAKP